MLLSEQLFNRRRLLVFLIDLLLMASAFSASFLLRFDFRVPSEMVDLYRQGLVVVMLAKPLVFITSGLYRSLWRYASLQDGIEIFKVVTVSSIIAAFTLMYFRHFAPYPRSIFVLDWILLFAMVVSSRLVWRVYRETVVIPRGAAAGRSTLIIGAGEAGSMLLKEIRRQAGSSYQVVGFVDDDRQKIGMRLHGVAVLGTTRQLKAIIRKHAIEDVIIAIPSANGKTVREIVNACERCKVRFKTLPAISEIIEGNITISQIKDVEAEDLLGREPVRLDKALISNYLAGKRVLVTGAAGSIGSEICRQVAQFGPAKLMLFEQAETPLYEIEKELLASFPDLLILPLIGDVRDKAMVETVFREFTPQVVFHAAAYKHVPMMEYNPAQAVLNNVAGSQNVADAAHRFRAGNFVMISTDKAVNPTNVMGATKRAAEIYVQALSRTSETKFTTVRFGNVLGSNGSVIPLFKDQIAKGGPVTVTDRRIIRYFMTIPEATQLVLQAGSMGNKSDILVLDMGEPVRIIDLAEELIRLSGLIPYEDIDIVFTGLRPGEKLFEELLIDGEGLMPTDHDKIKVMAPVQIDIEPLRAELGTLYGAARNNDIGALIESLKRLVPEFRPAYSFQGDAPMTFKRVRPDLFPVNPASKAKVLSLKQQTPERSSQP